MGNTACKEGRSSTKAKSRVQCGHMERARPCFLLCLRHSTKEKLQLYFFLFLKKLSLLFYPIHPLLACLLSPSIHVSWNQRREPVVPWEAALLTRGQCFCPVPLVIVCHVLSHWVHFAPPLSLKYVTHL